VLEGWYTPWIKGGMRNLFLPLLGLAVRLCGAVAGRYICLYSVTFMDGTMQEGSGGTVCVSDSFAPMEVFQVLLEFLMKMDLMLQERLIVIRCAWCGCARWPIQAPPEKQEWLEPVEFARRGGVSDGLVSHGICDRCEGLITGTVSQR
jgi:hypothetical protein